MYIYLLVAVRVPNYIADVISQLTKYASSVEVSVSSLSRPTRDTVSLASLTSCTCLHKWLLGWLKDR